MIRVLTLFLLVFFHVGLAFGQEEELEKVQERRVTIYLKSSLNEPNLGIQTRIGKKLGAAVEGGYAYRFSSSAHFPYYSILWPPGLVQFRYAFSGWKARALFNIHWKKGRVLSTGVQLRDVSARRIINDEGFFGGSNTSPYSEYSQQTRDAALMVEYRFRHLVNIPAFNQLNPRLIEDFFPKIGRSWVEFFVGLQVRYQEIDRQFFVGGAYNNQVPSNRSESFNRILPAMTYGLKINLWTAG